MIVKFQCFKYLYILSVVLAVFFIPILQASEQENDCDKMLVGDSVIPILTGLQNQYLLVGMCSICFEDLNYDSELFFTRCSHWFHKSCIEEWISAKLCKSCPICRSGASSSKADESNLYFEKIKMNVPELSKLYKFLKYSIKLKQDLSNRMSPVLSIMKLKASLNFDTTDDDQNDYNFNTSSCIYLPDSNRLIYVEGSYLLTISDPESPLEDTPSIEFPSNIVLLRKIDYKKDSFLFIVLEDGSMAIIDLKNDKIVSRFDSLFPSKILQIRQSPKSQQVFLLIETGSLLQIDNFVLFTRLSNDLLKERYESGQILKEYTTADAKQINDFQLFEGSGQLEILTVGSDNMITWWTISDEKDENDTDGTPAHPSIINFFFKKESKPAEIQTEKPSKRPLRQVRFLNEPDRVIDRIICSKGSLALLEDSTHGRLLFLETELGLILKMFKGYRNTSAIFTGNNGFILWAQNRLTLESWSNLFDDSTKSLVQEHPNSNASFDQNNNLFVYSSETLKLSLYI